MPAPWLCAAGKRLRDQVNARFPDRDKQSDGWVADQHHPTTSDHSPRPDTGVARAIDIDEDLLGPLYRDPEVADHLVADLISSGDPRLRYVIFESQIWSASNGWAPRTYTGANAHAHHIHVSFTPAGDDDGRPFALPLFAGQLPPLELARGARGPEVAELQTTIRALYEALRLDGRDFPGLRLALDGDFGAATERAVRALQGLYALPVTGSVTPKLRAALDLP